MAVMSIVDRVIKGLAGSIGGNKPSAYSVFARGKAPDKKPAPSATPGDYGDRESALKGKSLPAAGDGTSASKTAKDIASGTLDHIRQIAEKQKKKDTAAAAAGHHPEHEKAEVKAWDTVQKKLSHPLTVAHGLNAITPLVSFPLTPHPEVLAEKMAAKMDWAKTAEAVEADGLGPGVHPAVTAAGLNAMSRLISFPFTPHPDTLVARMTSEKMASAADTEMLGDLASSLIDGVISGYAKTAGRSPGQPKKEKEEGADTPTRTPIQGVEV